MGTSIPLEWPSRHEEDASEECVVSGDGEPQQLLLAHKTSQHLKPSPKILPWPPATSPVPQLLVS